MDMVESWQAANTLACIYQNICNQKIEIFQLRRLLWPAYDLNPTWRWLEWSVLWPMNMHCTSALAVEEGNAFRNKKIEDIVTHIKVLRNFTLQVLKASNQDANLLNSNVPMIKKKQNKTHGPMKTHGPWYFNSLSRKKLCYYIIGTKCYFFVPDETSNVIQLMIYIKNQVSSLNYSLPVFSCSVVSDSLWPHGL